MRKKFSAECHAWLGKLIAGTAIWLAASNVLSATDIDALIDARDIYQANCAMCHGYDGVPILPGAPNFANGDRLDRGDPELLETMRNGKGTMPAWKDVMDDAEQQGALNYVRVVGGDSVFETHCSECHDSGVPALSATVLLDGGEPKDDISPEEICTDVEIENIMEPEDFAKLVNFLGRAPKLFLLTP